VSQAPERRARIKRLAAAFAIAAGVVVVGVGVGRATTGKAAQKLPKEIEDIAPVRAATQVQQQESIVVDFIDGYTGVLVVNGVEVPTVALDQIESAPGRQPDVPAGALFEQGNDTLRFTPGDAEAVQKYDTGINTVSVIYWKVDQGRNFAKPTFSWQFDVV
jgi:hypothetical protein